MSFAEEPQSFETEREPNDVIGKVVGVPRRPPNFQARPEEINAAKSRLLADDKSSTGITALQGMGGIGKSVLAAELARDNDVLCRFPDGVFWVTVGQSPHRRVSLHDLQHDFITIRYQKKYGAPKALHIQLLDAYQKQCSGGWPRGPDPDDGYFFQHLAHHLRESGKTDELRTLLLDFDWLQSKLTHTDVVSLLSDFSHVNEDEDLRLLHDTIRLSAHVLASDSTLYMLSLHLADAD
jgi:hypothetical protein